MHIPDGYLSPVVSMGLAAVSLPVWGIATRRVRDVLDNRTIPLLAIFAALSFTIQMFNIPVPGGTTAHAVAATLAAVVIGPWAAVISISTAIIIQALFFGDGGILAIFANGFNMGILMPLTGYACFRLLAGRSAILSPRRAWAAGIAGYIAISLAAVSTGILLGIEPIFFTENGRALYSPYGLGETIPAMLISHLPAASVVEGLVTGLGIAFLQKRYPEYLGTFGSPFAAGAVEEGAAPGRPLWQIFGGVGAGLVVILGIVGLVTGGGNPAHAFGLSWASVDWPAVATMLLVVAIIGVVLVPVAYLVLPGRMKKIGAGFTLLAVLAPLGLIAPGFAYGEGTAEQLQAAFGYVPTGFQQISRTFSAPFAGYSIPLPFFENANSALWRAAVGYEIVGILGILTLGAVMLDKSLQLCRVE